MKHIVIIGNGITGTTVARHVRKKSQNKITVISRETEYFFSRTALMYVYMGHMTFEQTKPYEDWFWKKNNINLIKSAVTKINHTDKFLLLENEEKIEYDELVLATGASPNKFGWPGQDLDGVQGLFSYQDLMTMEKYTQGISRAVIVGGGLIGVEMAEMLLSRGIPVTFLVREKLFWHVVLPSDEASMIGRHIQEHHVDLKFSTELKMIKSDGQGRVKAIVTGDDEEIQCQFVGLTAGVHPNIELLRNTEIKTDRGILVNQYLETNIPHVYAAGDCAQFMTPLPGRRPIEQVWYTGKMQGETLAHTLTGDKKAYQPGIWFNSAKFFDIEYQTYGLMPSKVPEDENSFYWEAPDGKKCLRINFKKEGRAVMSFNFLGIRARHAVCEKWIMNKMTIEHVLSHLKACNFDPEFFKSYEKEIIAKYNQDYPDFPAANKVKKGLFSSYLRKNLIETGLSK